MPHTVNAVVPLLGAPLPTAPECQDDAADRGVLVMDAEHGCRGRAEALIRDVYRERYSAEIPGWMRLPAREQA